jgi:hypothetical protein
VTDRRVVVEFDTTKFVVAHGHAPRGTGSWAFAEAQPGHRFDTTGEVLWAPYGTLTDAKRWARAQVKARHAAGPGRSVYVTIVVLP